MSLPTIESSFVTHGTNSIQGFDHAEYPVLRLALEVLNATEGYLWVSPGNNLPFMIIDLIIGSVAFVEPDLRMALMCFWISK